MTVHTDTQPEAEALLLSLLREAPPWRKLEMLGQLNRMARNLALSGLRQRHPQATPEELQRRLADLLLGPTWLPRRMVPWLQRSRRLGMLFEPTAVTLLVTEALESLGVSYLIGGSLASTIHGLVRTTQDTDLVADLRPEHVTPFVHD